eukprot:1271343-Pleurochrysis_carterae.AAC.1
MGWVAREHDFCPVSRPHLDLSRPPLLPNWLGQKLVDGSLSPTTITLYIEDAFFTRLQMA